MREQGLAAANPDRRNSDTPRERPLVSPCQRHTQPVASNEAARGSGFSAPVSRRAVFGGLSPLPLVGPVPGVLPAASADPAYRFLSPHQVAVLDAATRRLVPGPEDDALELDYLDRLLSVFDVARTFAGRQRVANLRDQYINGIALLDQQAGGDFTAVPPLRQDLILSQRQAASFASLLFDHIIEGMYAVPDRSPTAAAAAAVGRTGIRFR